ncbi:hypothetical protein CHLNCDRAFT_138102 [Chlorella variabilis]|uniref:N-alpha-acetyltransferase 60 n=1 Tax=Chlorella variabilis TaxID=554065 RepID=E1Z596_CHLVA|nr:hypothetical protein CHLNCDRAFT_138102 [Chlorella variabilis]EFN59486.1 hypothetical protein CHLNCDRAFT_138102 [Chlorella variabilis]|eukprot:XP_005851588.1 hypothetical protein CHLNCDRAFT_138102 [Chlorella variabilis]
MGSLRHMPGTSSGVYFRPLHPDDFASLKLLHQRLFPLDYDDFFYHRAVQGLDGIVAWAASAPLPTLTHLSVGPDLAPQLQQPQQSQPPPPPKQVGVQGSEATEMLAGFITARSFPALYADPRDRQLLGLDGPEVDKESLLYVLTLGVAEPYQRHGIARRLLDFVLRYAAETACRAVYLHVASFNLPALAFYQRAGFQELAVLPNFYTIRTGRQPIPTRQQYDACLFGCLINPPQPTPWGSLNYAVMPLTAVIGSLNSCLPWGSDRRKHQGTAAAGAGGAAAAPLELREMRNDGGGPDLEAQQNGQHPTEAERRQQRQRQQRQQQPQFPSQQPA